MATVQRALPVGDVTGHIASTLAGGPPCEVRWRDGDAALLVDVAALEVALGDGWLAVEVPVTCDQAGRQPLRAVLHLGAPGDGDGAAAAFALDPGAPAVVAARWRAALRDRLWGAVLDVLECAVAATPGGARVVGFACTERGIDVEVELATAEATAP